MTQDCPADRHTPCTYPIHAPTLPTHPKLPTHSHPAPIVPLARPLPRSTQSSTQPSARSSINFPPIYPSIHPTNHPSIPLAIRAPIHHFICTPLCCIAPIHPHCQITRLAHCITFSSSYLRDLFTIQFFVHAIPIPWHRQLANHPTGQPRLHHYLLF